jgi:hypothetical protein
MITGRPAFRGDTSMSTLAGVINQNPEPAGPDVPRELERITFRCLRKDADRRFHHVIDLKVALAELKDESDSGAVAVAPSPRRRRRGLALAALAAVATALIAVVLLWKKAPGNPVEAERIRVTFDSGLTTDPALSLDGKLVVYSSDRAGEGNLDIWIKNLASPAWRLWRGPLRAARFTGFRSTTMRSAQSNVSAESVMQARRPPIPSWRRLRHRVPLRELQSSVSFRPPDIHNRVDRVNNDFSVFTSSRPKSLAFWPG